MMHFKQAKPTRTKTCLRQILFLIIVAFASFVQAQGSYKVVFEGPDHAIIDGITSLEEGSFIVTKLNYPLNTFKVITSDIYTFNNNYPFDTIHWNLDFDRQDTSLRVEQVHRIEDSGFIIVGAGEHYTNTNELQIQSRFNWMMRLDTDRNLLWEKFYPLPQEVRKTSDISFINLLVLRLGNYLIAESIENDSLPWIVNTLMIEINPQGNRVETKLIDQEISGSVMSLTYNYDSSNIMIHKFGRALYDCPVGTGAMIMDTSNYSIIGTLCYWDNGDGFNIPYDAKLDSEGDLIVAGSYSRVPGSTYQRYLGVKKFDTSYQVVNDILLTDPDTMTYAASSKCLDINEQGEIFVAGEFDDELGFFSSYYDLIYFAKLDQDLNLISERYIGRDADYTVFSVAATSDGGVVIGGSQYDYQINEPREADPFIIKTDAGLWLDTPQIREENVHRALVYPNPGSQQLNVRTTIKQAVFSLYNVNGKLVLEQPLDQLITNIITVSLAQGAYLWTVTQKGQVSDRGKWVKY